MEERRNNFGRIAGKIRTKKLNARVDLTAMVSVSFLLIVFFMLTSYMSKPQKMDLDMPDKFQDDYDNGIVCGLSDDDNVMTLLLGENGTIVSYWGNFYSFYENPKRYNCHTDALVKELISGNRALHNLYGDHRKGLIVLIKPSKQSNYGDLVTVLDKLTITKTPTYAIIDINREEEKLLAEK